MRKTLVHCLIPLLPIAIVGGVASFFINQPVREERGLSNGHAFVVWENNKGEVRLNLDYSFTNYADLDGNGTCDKVETFYCAPRMGAIGISSRKPETKEVSQFAELTSNFYSQKTNSNF